MTHVEFSEWLQSELEKRQWSQSEFARRAGLSRQAVSDYINRKRLKPDEDSMKKISHVLQVPLVLIYRLVGNLPPVAETEYPFEQAQAQYEMLSEERKHRIQRQIQLELELQAEEERNSGKAPSAARLNPKTQPR